MESKICRDIHLTIAYITEIGQFQKPYEAKYRSLKNQKNSPYSHDKNYNSMQPATKPSENKVGCPQMHLGKVTILHISLRSIVEYFARNSLHSFGKKFCKQFASLIWQKKSLSRANFAYFASLNICKIILNVCSLHYLQMNL